MAQIHVSIRWAGRAYADLMAASISPVAFMMPIMMSPSAPERGLGALKYPRRDMSCGRRVERQNQVLEQFRL